MPKRILAINPGSTSTKVALFEGDEMLFEENLDLSGIDYAGADGEGNLDRLHKSLLGVLSSRDIEPHSIDAIAARSGAMAPGEAGVYVINQRLLDENDYSGGHVHASVYSAALALRVSRDCKCAAYVINSQAVDELEMPARPTGMPGVYRKPAVHALNQKAVAERCARAVGKRYEDANVIVAHMGGGVSVVAHRQGRMVDFSGSAGEGPMAPTRSGTVPMMNVVRAAFSGDYSKDDLLLIASGHGGLSSWLGTSDAREVEASISRGDSFAKAIYEAMLCQIAKNVCALAAPLEGRVDCIGLTGGLAHSEYVQRVIDERCSWLAPIKVFAGEYEMSALAGPVLAVLEGRCAPHEYRGEATFDPAAFEATRKPIEG